MSDFHVGTEIEGFNFSKGGTETGPTKFEDVNRVL